MSEEMSKKEFGLHVLVQRKKTGLTQAELSIVSGISRNYISMIERGVATNVSKHILRSLAHGFGDVYKKSIELGHTRRGNFKMTLQEIKKRASENPDVLPVYLYRLDIKELLEIIDAWEKEGELMSKFQKATKEFVSIALKWGTNNAGQSIPGEWDEYLNNFEMTLAALNRNEWLKSCQNE